MSAIVILQQTDAIHLITDGATYRDDGTVLEIRSKVTPLPAANCALAMRGGTWACQPLAAALSLCGSFDEIAEVLPDVVAGMTATYEIYFGDRPSHPKHFEIVIAGWSDNMDRMVAAVALTRQRNDPDDPTGFSTFDIYEPGTLFVPGQGCTIPAIDIEATLGRSLTTQADIDALDPGMDGFTLHAAQRREPGLYRGRAAYIIGGFAELTTVTRHGIESQVIHEWPDAVGQKITPVDAPPLEVAQRVVDAVSALRAAQQSALMRSPAGPELISQAA
ncbi:hypothetical protein D0Z70_22520 [Sphingobium terrigena]|uniref:Uncharacterized protein n=1 Tax=Sphingobium terrigena TaxID=2304063 RepID=A0A418YLE2_9SPHN|nr:hypothetical protein [Sphingobium terrigena]RJG51807.1 hypothetical protein D0Z70_22520 [Sphingobium terrigena]